LKFVTTIDEDGKEELFSFPDGVHHDAMAEILGRIKNQTHGTWFRVYREPISAGFIDVSGTCYGQSETLGLASRPEDTALYAKQLESRIA
jgi:hypothetical protein